MFHLVVVILMLLGLPAGLSVDYTAITSRGFVTVHYAFCYSLITTAAWSLLITVAPTRLIVSNGDDRLCTVYHHLRDSTAAWSLLITLAPTRLIVSIGDDRLCTVYHHRRDTTAAFSTSQERYCLFVTLDM